MRKRTAIWSAKKAAPAIARAAPAIARAAAPGLARAAGTLLAPEVGLALAAGGALYSTVKGLADMYHSTPSEYTKITAHGAETYHSPAHASPKPLGLPHRVSHRHPTAQIGRPPPAPASMPRMPDPSAPALAPPPTAPASVPRMPDPSASAPALAPPTMPQTTRTAPDDPHRISMTTVGIKPFRIGSEPFNLVQWEANTHEIAEQMMGGRQ